MAREYVKSICALVWGVASRFYFALPAILFDPKDIYSETLKNTPPEWESLHAAAQVLAGVFDLIPPDTFWWVLALTALWALVCTYHEARSSAATGHPTPDWSARDAFRHVMIYSKWALGRHPDDKKYYEAVQRTLTDSASIGALWVWARPVTGSFHTEGKLQRLRAIDWKDLHFDYVSCASDATDTAEIIDYGNNSSDRYVDAQVNRAQVMSLWPKASRWARWRDGSYSARLQFHEQERDGYVTRQASES